jgi:hypothetical protein
MKIPIRYARLWLALPAEERRARTGRVLDRWLRRPAWLRRILRLTASPSAWRFRRALLVAPAELARRLREPGAGRHPLWVPLAARAARAASAHPGTARHVVDHARQLTEGRFDLLGSGPCRPVTPAGGIDWHRDFKSGLSWDPGTYFLDVVTVRGDGSDVKVPWELSRFQHLLVLGQAWHLCPRLLAAGDSEAFRSRCALSAVRQIEDWIQANPKGLGVNWTCTMDVSIRAASWVAALALFREAPEWTDAFRLNLARALWGHGIHIRQNLEVGDGEVTSNHYLADIAGLHAIALALPELREAARWRAFCRAALVKEMQRQVGPDGVDFERSIPYHRLVAEMFFHGALLEDNAGTPMPELFLRRFAAMIEFTTAVTRPDGSVPQIGDNDDGRFLPLDGYASRAPHDHRGIVAAGARLLGRDDLESAGGDRDWEALWLFGPRSGPIACSTAPASGRVFRDSGFCVLRCEDAHITVPCGRVGTSGIGNHSHNDVLSVCIWAAGREWITDPGTGTYTGDPALRNHFRSTAAHATVQIDAREQNVFGPALDDLFLLRERARPEIVRWDVGSGSTVLAARHRGFSMDDCSWLHERRIRLDGLRSICVIEDQVEREPPFHGDLEVSRVFLRLPLASDVVARPPVLSPLQSSGLDEIGAPAVETLVLLSGRQGERAKLRIVLPAEDPTVEIVEAPYSPRYGVVETTRVIVASSALRSPWRAITSLVASRTGDPE